MNKIKDLTIAFAGTVVRVALVILAVICILRYAGKAYNFGYRIFAEEPMSDPPGRDITVTVTADDSQSEIMQMLEDKGIIRDHKLFTIQKKLSLYKEDVKPGTYVLNTSMNSDELIELLAGVTDESDELDTVEALSEEIDPLSDDLTGLESGGVLSEEGSYDEGAAFTDESGEGGSDNEYEGEGDEESALED